jgi:hypothetical protein
VDVAAIRALTAQQSTTYINGYGLENIATVAARRAAIGQAVGCTVAI